MELNLAQRRAADADDRPLLIIAGAGTGKTQTLAHRVAALIARGADSRRILLLTFSRRAAQEMTRRALRIVAAARARGHTGGRRGAAVGGHVPRDRQPPPSPARARGRSGPGVHAAGSGGRRRSAGSPAPRARPRAHRAALPRKGTCLAIYSSVVNTQEALRDCLRVRFPWCLEWEEPLRALFAAFVEAKAARAVLDYDDLLLYWFHFMTDASAAARVGGRFDHVLVDEYQDTNTLQAEILRAMKPDGRGVTVVGDDAQAIYSFRAARVRQHPRVPAASTIRPPRS